jgi:hypothetical protein
MLFVASREYPQRLTEIRDNRIGVTASQKAP